MTQHLSSWRSYLTNALFFSARALEEFAVAIPRSADLIEANRRRYDSRGSSVSEESATLGFLPQEKQLLDRLSLHPGRALVLGSGGGRESIALAREGWRVAGVDGVPSQIRIAQAKGAEAGVAVDWHCWDVTDGIPPLGEFDLICLFNIFYSLIPGRKRRVEVLESCRDHLAPGGVCLVSLFMSGSSPSKGARFGQAIRRGVAGLLLGNTECQMGDSLGREGLFTHRFFPGEFNTEASAAGFEVTAENSGIPHAPWVLRRRSP